MYPRRPSLVIAVLVGVSFLAGFLLIGRNLSPPGRLPFFNSDPGSAAATPGLNTTHQDILNVAIVETNGWHEEVVAALAHSFGSQPNVQLHIYPTKPRFGMSEMISTFQFSHPLPAAQPPDELMSDSVTPDIIVLTTGELDSVHLQSKLNQILASGHTYLYCVVHHGDHWNDAKIREVIAPWIDKRMIDFVTLSPHTATFLKANGLRDWSSSTPIIKSITPLFPISEPSADRKGIIDKQRELAFAIQGNYEPSRRDFDNIFSHLQSFIRATKPSENKHKSPNVTLHLLGSGERPPVPSDLSSHVFFDEGLSYSEYYAVLSNTFAMLPAFADDSYLDRKASSTVPASLLGGTPLVATKKILSAYSYLPEEAVYLQREGETELATVGRILQLEEKERKAKTIKVRQTCMNIIENNVQLVGGWIKEAQIKIG